MEGLNAYLAAQHSPVASLGMAAPEIRNAAFAGEHSTGQRFEGEAGAGTGQGMHRDSSQDGRDPTQQQASSGPGAGPDERTSARPSTEADSDPRLTAITGMGSAARAMSAAHLSAVSTTGEGESGRIPGNPGVHISVMA